MALTSNRPYLIRALYEWLLDNGLTPHLLVEADGAGVVIPTQYVEEGRILFNISPSAVQQLQLGNDLISFRARFGGTPMEVRVPPTAVLGIYARENGRGMLFPQEGEPETEGPPPDSETPPPSGRPSLKVIK
jgi:stringent starvation protein B